jgi:hypothetical protein
MESNPDDTLIEWLSEFYDLLLTTWHTQIKWCCQVFEEPVQIVCDLLTETLKGLDPSLPQTIVEYLQNGENTLLCLIELKQVSICSILSKRIKVDSK